MPTVLYFYAEFTVSSLAVAVTTGSTDFVLLRRDGQAELAWVAKLSTKITIMDEFQD